MISYQKLFDFDGLEKKFGTLDAEYQKFVKNTADGSNIVKQAITSYTKDLSDLLRELRTLNTAQAGSNRRFEEQAERAAASSKRLEELRGIIATLTDAQNANGVSIDKLKGSIDLLKKEYDQLDPKQNDFKQKQKEIADKVKLAKQAIDAQTTTLKAANQTISTTVNNYTSLSKKTNELRNQLRNLDGAFDLTTGKINRTNKEAVALLYTIQQNDAALKRMDASMGQHQRSVGNYGSALNGVKGNLLAFTGAAFGIDSALTAITKTFEVINDFSRYRNALEVASGSTKRFNSNLAFLEKLANDTGTAIETLYPSFTKLEVAARGTTMQGQKVRDVFSGIVKMGASLSLTNEDIEGTLKAIEQAMSKGKIQSEEWRGQVGDRLPGAFKLLAEAMGITTAKLDKMMSDGDVYAEDVLPKVAAQIEKTYGDKASKNLETMVGQTNRLKNETSLLIDEFARDAKVNSFFGSIVKGIADTIGAWRALAKEKGFLQTMILFGGMASTGSIAGFNAIADAAKKRADGAQELDYYGPFNGKDAAGRAQQITAQRATAQLAKQEYENFNGKYDPKKKKELMEYANEEYKRLNTIIILNDQLLKKEKALADERAAADKDKDKRAKKQLSELEKFIDATEKLTKTLMDDALGDVQGNRMVQLPEKATKKWYELYAVLDQLARKLGVEIPSGIEKTKSSLDRFLGKDVLSSLKVNSINPLFPNAALPLEEKVKFAPGNKLPGLDDFLNFTLRQETERLDLQRMFSGKLRSLKQEEKKELLRILAEIQKAERDGDDEKKKRLKEQYDYTLGLARDEAAERRMLQQQFTQTSLELTQAGIDLYMSLQQKKLDHLQKQYDYEVKLAGDNEEAKGAITERFAKQSAEIKRKQAIAEKAMAAFQAGLNTATSIIGMLANPGGPAGIALSVIAGATGALQLANILAKPLPAFKKGTQNAPEGPALVAEAGPELHESRGRFYLHEKPSIVPLKRGDKIYPAEETSRMLADQFRSQELNTVMDRTAITDSMTKNLIASQKQAQFNMNYAIQQQLNMNIDRLGGKFNDAIDRLPQTDFFFDEEGFRKRVQKDNSIITYRNARRRF